MKTLILVSILLLTGCSQFIQPDDDDITVRRIETSAGIIGIGNYRTEGCSVHLPPLIQTAVIKGKLSLVYRYENEQCGFLLSPNE